MNSCTISKNHPNQVIGVYCASSRACHPDYHQAAFRLGATLAGQKITILYGGGKVGSMGALADGALSQGGKVIGIIPRFMVELEWGHNGLSELQLVEDLRERKQRILSASHAVVALPGGCGTLEELLEAITLKRLGIYLGPIVLVNTRNFFDPLNQLLSHAIDEKFMDERHRPMWQTVTRPEDVLPAILAAPQWTAAAYAFAAR